MNITDMVVKLSTSGAGPVVMWFMVLLSIVSVAVMIERLIFFTKEKGDARSMAVELNKLFMEHDYDKARKLLEQTQGYEARVVLAALDGAPLGAHAVKELAQSAGKIERLRFERGLAFLGTVGNNAPFVGLFGTVLEIIAALHDMGMQNAATTEAGQVMSTLSAALAATAVGLIVAMPAVAVFNYFQRRLKALTTSADALVHVLLAHLEPDSHEDPGPEKKKAA